MSQTLVCLSEYDERVALHQILLDYTDAFKCKYYQVYSAIVIGPTSQTLVCLSEYDVRGL